MVESDFDMCDKTLLLMLIGGVEQNHQFSVRESKIFKIKVFIILTIKIIKYLLKAKFTEKKNTVIGIVGKSEKLKNKSENVKFTGQFILEAFSYRSEIVKK